jgi:hypothetical protein
VTGTLDDTRREIEVVPELPAVTARRATPLDWLLGFGLGACVVVVHSVGDLMHRPYWTDEAWVATLTRASLADALRNASSTPLGWLLLIRAVPGHEPPLRLVSLAFAGATVVVAYFLARRLPYRSAGWARAAAVATAGVVLLAPIALMRDDLKQYTADALVALVLMLLVCRIDEAATPRRYVALAAAVVIATPFSTAAAFAGAAAFAAVIVVALARRGPERRAALLAGAITAAFLGLWFVALVMPRDGAALRDFWRDWYLDGTPWHALQTAAGRLSLLATRLAMPALVFVAVVALGCMAVARLQRPALALVVPLLWAEMFAVSYAKQYPFGDARTSHFMLIASLAVGTIGVISVLAAIAIRSPAGSIALGVVVAGAFLFGSVGYVRGVNVPPEDARSQAHYVAQHRRPGDVVVVSVGANWAFAYYSPNAIDFVKAPHLANGFVARPHGMDGVLYVPSREPADVVATLRDALAQRGPNGRVWLVRSHVMPSEAAAWQQAEQTLHVAPQSVPAGDEPVAVVEPARSPGASP